MQYTIKEILFQHDTICQVKFKEKEGTQILSKQPEDQYVVGEKVKPQFY